MNATAPGTTSNSTGQPATPLPRSVGRTNRRTTLRSLQKLVVIEIKLFLREPLGAFFGLIFPAVLILVLGSALPGFREPSEDLGGERPVEVYLPIVLAMTIATVALISLLNSLSTNKEKGILRRLSTTPVAPISLLVAQLVVNVIALIAGSGLALLAAWAAFGVGGPGNPVGLVIAFVLGSAAMVAVALLIAAVSPSNRASVGFGSLVYYPMLFAAGVWTPGPAMPDAVRRVADFTPLGAASQAMQDAWAGDWPRPLHLAVLLAFTAAFAAVAAKLFRWK